MWDFDPPKFVYKYLKAKHVEGMLSRGTVRIGTLYEFRDQELHGPARGDRDEGTIDLSHSFRHATTADILASPVGRNVITFGPGGSLTLDNITLQQKQSIADAFIYCISMERSQRLMKDFEADACIQISDVVAFMTILGNDLMRRRLAVGWTAGTCSYEQRAGQVGEDISPVAFVKDPSFEHQREGRLVAKPVRLPIKPVIVNCRKIRPFLTKVSV